MVDFTKLQFIFNQRIASAVTVLAAAGSQNEPPIETNTTTSLTGSSGTLNDPQGPSAVSRHTASPTSLAFTRANKEKSSLIGSINCGHSDPVTLIAQMFSTILSPTKSSML